MLATIALLAFLPFAILVFRRLPKAQAAAIVVIAGSILLPERVSIDLPIVPPMDKEYITYLSALIAGYVTRPRTMARARPFRGLELIVVLTFLGNIATAAMNSQPMLDEGRLEDGLGLYWLIAQTVDDVLTLAVPYLVGRALFTSIEDLYALLSVLVVAAAAYTGLIAIEIVLSIPFRSWQFAQVIYGLPGHPMDRWGLNQPMVFMDNGLSLASFMAVALIGAAALVKANLPLLRRKGSRIPRPSARLLRNIVTAGTVMSLNVAGNVYGLTFLTAYTFLRPRLVALLAVSLTSLALLYPSLRLLDVFPHQAIVDFAAEYDQYRARSLGGRFDEEDFVLGQIGDRLLFGWGTYSRIPGAESFGEGEVGLDGWWTIQVGSSGVVGVLLYYAILAIPVYRGWRSLGRVSRTGGILVGSLLGMISVRMIDLILNGWWNCLPVFLAGVLSGVIGGIGRKT